MGGQPNKEISSLIRRKLDALASKVDHKGVIKNIYGEVDVSLGYFALLSIANLIALSGLVLIVVGLWLIVLAIWAETSSRAFPV